MARLAELWPAAYTPSGWLVVLTVVVTLAVIVVAGFLITRIRSAATGRLLAWTFVVLSVALMERIAAAEPAGVRMVVLILATLTSMKAVVALESSLRDGVALGFIPWAAFATGWFGMRPAAFLGVPYRKVVDVRPLVIAGTVHFLVGGLLVLLARWLAHSAFLPLGETARVWTATVILMLGLSLMLHFGTFSWMVALWRRLGAGVRPLFREPLVSRNLVEFWGERWNLAFVEMTSIGVYRPLRGVVSQRFATVAVFLFSGLLHELAISLPVMAGFGLPTLYFALHAAAVSIERHWQAQGRPINERGVWARVWTLAWIILPLPILFHPPFIRGCIWPLLGVEG